MLIVELSPGLPQKRRAYLRPLCGSVEALIQHGEREETLALLQELVIEDGEGAIGLRQIKDLPVCDIDRLLATLFLHYVGDNIESRIECRHCHEPFEFSFSLKEFVRASATQDHDEFASGPDDDGAFLMKDGRRFRLPTTRDLESLGGLDSKAAAARLRRACVIEGDPDGDIEVLENAMAAVGPVLDTDLGASCPFCEQTQQVHFEMQRHFGQTLAYERRFLTHEVHRLARAYGWQRSEIMAMTREDRRSHVRMVLAEGTASPRRRTTTF